MKPKASDLKTSAKEVSCIKCSQCGREDCIDFNSTEAADFFFDMGWRMCIDDVYCKKCAKRKKKESTTGLARKPIPDRRGDRSRSEHRSKSRKKIQKTKT